LKNCARSWVLKLSDSGLTEQLSAPPLAYSVFSA